MLPVAVVSALLWAAAPDVAVTLLTGEERSGALQSIADGVVQLKAGEESVAIPAAEALEIRFPAARAEEPLQQERNLEARLIDGTLLYCTSATFDRETAHLVSEVLGEIDVPTTQLRSLRIAPLEPKIADAWREQMTRESRSDLLIVRKGDSLDFVGGVISGMNEASISVLVSGRDVELPRERVFGILFVRPEYAGETATCDVALDTGDRLRAATLSVDESQVALRIAAGPAVTAPLDRVRSLDFGLDRLRYLTDLTETAAYEPVGLISSPTVQRIRKDKNSQGGRLTVGGNAYTRGLWLHSGTTLRYRLNRDYRRLQAVAGIEQSAAACVEFTPRVHVTIVGDDKTLFDAEFTWDGEPQPLDLDVAGVRDLEIRVQPASPESIGACEHFALADARVIK